MPRLEMIEGNAALARAFKPLSRRERNRLVDSIETARKRAMVDSFRHHPDA
jgi:hypothetical protein